MEIKELSLLEKMSAISNEVGSVEKNLKISTGKSTYTALSNVDVINAVKPIMAKYRVYAYAVDRKVLNCEVLDVLQPDQSIKKLFYCNLETTMRFANLDNSADYIDVKGYGTGLDSGDKSFGKANSYSEKYCLLSALMLAGEDPDTEASKDITVPAEKKWYDEPATQDQKNEIIQAGYAITDYDFRNLTRGKAWNIIKEIRSKK